MSPRSISQFSNLSKIFGDNDTLPKVRDPLNKSNRRIIVDSTNKFPAGYSSVGFSLNGHNMNTGNKQVKSKQIISLRIQKMGSQILPSWTPSQIHISISISNHHSSFSKKLIRVKLTWMSMLGCKSECKPYIMRSMHDFSI